MAPLDPAVIHKSNTRPLATFAGQTLLIAGLTAHILRTIRRAAKSLRAPSSTRTQQQVRRRNVAIFSILALLSIVSVTTFSIAWRVLSYFQWAETGNHDTPGSLWNDWFGTGQEGIDRWALGDWWSDVDLMLESDKAALESPEGFLYTCQHVVGLAAAAMFYGVEGRRRNLPNTIIASFVILSAFGSLGFALNLFFVTMLYTPVALHDPTSPRHDALFAPVPAVLYLPVIGSILYLQYTPYLVAHRADLTYVRAGHFADLLFLAFAPQVVPLRWGHRHTSVHSAHRSFGRAFYALGITSLLLHWKVFATSLLVNTPPWHSPAYDLFLNAIGKGPKTSRLHTALATTAQKLKLISKHPIVSSTGNDIAFTIIGLLAWTFIRQLDVHELLDNSFLWLLTPPKGEKHVSFKDDLADTTHEITDHAASSVTPKKRGPGRPRKNIANGTDATPLKSPTGTLRRSSRRKTRSVNYDYESDAESSYEPPLETAKAIKQIEADGSAVDDVVAGGESTALALVLTFVGGVGQLAAAVLGAEVTAE